MFKDDLQAVAVDLIGEFGSTGHFNIPTPPDPITGEGGSATPEEVKYFREFYADKELIENRIINGDAKLIIVRATAPKTSWTFTDDGNIDWNIESVTPVEAQGMDIVYEVHIRK